MKLQSHIQTILLYPTVNANLGCEGKAQCYSANLNFIIVKRKKNAVLIRAKNAGFTWIAPQELISSRK